MKHPIQVATIAVKCVQCDFCTTNGLKVEANRLAREHAETFRFHHVLVWKVEVIGMPKGD